MYQVPGAIWAEPDLSHAADWLWRLAEDLALRRTIGPAGKAMALVRVPTASLDGAVRSLGIGIEK